MSHNEIEQRINDVLDRYSRAIVNEGDASLLEELLFEAQQHDDHLLQSRIHLARAVQNMVEGNRTESLQFCDEGLHLVGGTNTDYEVDLLVVKGRLLLATNANEALSTLSRAHDISTELHGAPHIHTRLRYAEALAAVGDTSKAIELIRWCDQQYEFAGNSDGRSTVLRRLCSIMLNAGHFAPAIEYATEAIRISEDRPYARVESYKFLAMALTHSKSYAEAFEVARQALDQAQELSTKHTRADCLGIMGDIYLALNDLPHALSTFVEAMEVYSTLGFSNGVVMCLKSIGETYTRSGDEDEAVTVFNNALDIAIEINNTALVNAVVDALSALYKEIGKTNDAQRILQLRRDVNISPAADEISQDSVDSAVSVFREAKAQRQTRLPAFSEIKSSPNKRLGLDAPAARVVSSPSTSAPSTNGIHVRLLGGFSVTRDGQVLNPADWKRKKTRDVFKYLVTRHRQTIPVDEIVLHLWGEDADVEKCTPTLQNATSAIRTTLEPGIQRRQPSAYLHFVDGTYRLDLGPNSTVDIELFRSGLEGASTAGSVQIQDLTKALALYTGEFLPEDRFEEWTSFYRSFLLDAAVEGLDLLASLQFDAGDSAAAKATMSRRNEIDPD